MQLLTAQYTESFCNL